MAGSGRPSKLQVQSGLGLAVVATAFSSIFITELEHRNVAPLVVAFYRMAVTTVILVPVAAAVRGGEMAALAQRRLGLMLLAGLCLAAHFAAWIASLKYIPISTSVVLVSSHPMLVVVASWLLLGERPTRRALAGTLFGLAGTAITCGDGLKALGDTLLGDGLAFGGAVAIVGYIVVGRKMRLGVSLLAYVTPLYAVCSLVLVVGVIIAGDRLYPYGVIEWSYFGALALVPTILGHTVFNWALAHVRASVVSMAFLGEPVVASILAFLFFGQVPPQSTVMGGALVLTGIYLSSQIETAAPTALALTTDSE